MIDHSQPSFREIRGYNRFSLETYADQLSNPFEPVVDKLIESHLGRIKGLKKTESQLETKIAKTKKPVVFQELLLKQSNVIGESNWLIDEIVALAEMKIIHAFKFFETKMKRVLKASMGEENTKDLHRWDAIKSFFKTKNIDIEGLKGYKEINQLREVNNAIKHSDEYTDRLVSVPEFAASKEVSFDSLHRFYNRTKNAPANFLHEPCLAISSELYDFDQDKIEKIAQDIAYRMEKNDAELLMQSIRAKYE